VPTPDETPLPLAVVALRRRLGLLKAGVQVAEQDPARHRVAVFFQAACVTGRPHADGVPEKPSAEPAHPALAG
jgi:hypothetical protein